MDFDIRSGPVSLSGEVAGGTRGYKGVYTIMRWDTKNRDGGFAFRALESQKSRRASSDRHAAVWIRFRPDRKTLARLWTGIRFENGVTVATYSAGLRRRVRSVVWSGQWRVDRWERGSSAGGLPRRIHVQADWEPIRTVRLRGRIAQARETARRRWDGLIDFLYRVRGRTTISALWSQYGKTEEPTSVFGETGGKTERRNRYALVVQSHPASGIEIAIRYALSRHLPAGRDNTPRRQMDTAFRVTVTW